VLQRQQLLLFQRHQQLQAAAACVQHQQLQAAIVPADKHDVPAATAAATAAWRASRQASSRGSHDLQAGHLPVYLHAACFKQTPAAADTLLAAAAAAAAATAAVGRKPAGTLCTC
jgi:hypothetical protein